MLTSGNILYSRVTEQPETEPVTLEEAKEHLEYDSDNKDAYIDILITAARKICETYTGLSFVTQERSIKLDRFPWSGYGYIYVPYGPVQAVTSITYVDAEGTVVDITEGTDFEIDTQSAVARFFPVDETGAAGHWPTDILRRANVVTITYQTGYDPASGEPLPAQAKIAILRLVAKMFEHRGDEGGKEGILDWDTQTLLDDIKVTWSAQVCTEPRY